MSPDTGNVKILKYVAVHDIGQPIHRAAAEGQIEGAAAMSIGQALCEQVVFDKDGRTMNPSFVDYLMPTINMMPRIETTLVPATPAPAPTAPKAPAKSPAFPRWPPSPTRSSTPPACGITKLPLSPENVLRGLKAAGKA